MSQEETDEQETAAEEAAAETEAPAEGAPAPETGEDSSGGDQAGAEQGEQPEQLHPKEARKRARSRHQGEARPQRDASERANERAERRRSKADSRRRYRAKQKAKKGEAGTGTPPAEREPGTRKVRQGVVTSSKPDKTITVQIESARRHPAYEKIVRRSKALHAHDENNEAGEGDTVRVIETRPMSKSKRWRLVEVVERAR